MLFDRNFTQLGSIATVRIHARLFAAI